MTRSPIFLCLQRISALFLIFLFITACASDQHTVTVTWIDTDGTLLNYLVTDTAYDPTKQPLPSDTDTWKYTGWSLNSVGSEIVCRAIRVKKVSVTWLDADGSPLKTLHMPYGEASPDLFPLPEDSDTWHYSGWISTPSSDGCIYKALRQKKHHTCWKDSNGSLLKECFTVEGTIPPTLELPLDSELWDYLEWGITSTDDETTYTAKRIPQKDYFVGNVLQIIVKDVNGDPLASGSGFVFNDEGWFITNDHVMANGHSASAFFDIRDPTSGSLYTELEIIGGVYHNSDKDIFIGRVHNYEKIKDFYHEIAFTESYEIGQNSYSIGYPNSSVSMEINAGSIIKEYSGLDDKIKGRYYILSDSYIAPGSSGGILVNDQLEILGITTIGLYSDSNKQIYQAGGSVPSSVFISLLEQSLLKTLMPIYKMYE